MVPGSAGPHGCSTLGGGWLHRCGSASRLGFGGDVTCPFPACSRLIIISCVGYCFARVWADAGQPGHSGGKGWLVGHRDDMA